MATKRADKLKAMQMPSSMAEKEVNQDLEMEMMDEMPEDEMEMAEEMPEDEQMDSPLADFSDDELMQELQARGLSVEEPEMEEEDMEEDMEEDEDLEV